jgi:hypothetical protein
MEDLMNYGRLLILGGILATLAAPALADPITYGEFDASGQGSVLTTGTGVHQVGSGFELGGTTGTTAGGNLRPTGTVTDDGSGVFGNFDQGLSFFYHFIVAPTPTPAHATFTFSTASVATPVEFLQATDNGVQMKFYITTVETPVLINSGGTRTGTIGSFQGVGYVTFSNEFAPGTPTVLYQEAVEYEVDTNKGAGLRPITVQILATDPGVLPEPSSFVLMGTGIFSTAGMLWRRRRLVA